MSARKEDGFDDVTREFAQNARDFWRTDVLDEVHGFVELLDPNHTNVDPAFAAGYEQMRCDVMEWVDGQRDAIRRR
jgi:hypothetical protein